MSDFSKIEDLAQRVADGLADEAMIADLEALLREDASARITYLQTLQLHQDLERKSARGTLGGENNVVDAPLEFPLSSSRRVSPFLAAAAVIMLVMTAWVWFAGGDEIGEMLEVSEAHWVGSPPGEKLQRDQRLQLASGSVELRLVSGVRVVFEGKVDAVLGSAMEIALNDGQLFAAVPGKARGFRVITPGMNVVDLGTQFGVRVAETGADVHVFEGEVEIEAVSSDAASQGVQTLTTAQAARFDSQGKLENWIAPDYEGFAAPLLAPGVVSTSKAVHWVEHPPSTFGFTDGRRVALVLERRNVLLEQPLEITFDHQKFDRSKSGTNSAYDSHREALEVGTRVDSYLLHFHPQKAGRGPNGGVQFDRPIIGAIARGDQLDASDAILGLPNVTYPTGARRGLEGDPEALDVIRMARHQLGVRFWASETNVDQVRILLEARSPILLQPQDEE